MTFDYSDNQKILSLTVLNTQKLVDYGVKIGSGVDFEKAELMLKALGLYDAIKYGNKLTASIMTSSIRTYIMSNQLLTQIAQKVPGFDWLNSKLQWQSSRWNVKDLVKASSEKQAFGRNAAGWLENDEWSISVTFLDDKLEGWVNPLDAPYFARININRKIAVNYDASVDESESTKGAIWTNPETGKTPTAIEPIKASTHPHTKNSGAIYQGFTNCSQLIRLADIFDKEDNSLPASIIGYSPSISDFVNNTLINSLLINKILKDKKQEIEDKVSQNLKDKPIILSESSNIIDINNRMRNQVFSVVFIELIKRNNKFEGFEEILDEDRIECERAWNYFFEQLITNSKSIARQQTEEASKNKFTDLANYFNDISKKNSDKLVKIEEIKDIDQKMDEVFWASKDLKAEGGEQKDFTSTDFKLTMHNFSTNFDDFENNKDPKDWTFKDNVLSSESNLKYFGLNFSSLFRMNYFYKSIIKEDLNDTEQLAKYWYDPDTKKLLQMPSSNINEFANWINDNEFISDVGFKNVFIDTRISIMLKHFILSNQEEIDSKNTSNEGNFYVDPFVKTDGSDVNSESEFLELLTNKNKNVDNNGDNLRIRHLNNIMTNEIDNRIENILLVGLNDQLQNSDTTRDKIINRNLWSYNLSSDFYDSEGNYIWNKIMKHYNATDDPFIQKAIFNKISEHNDDDIAFAEHLKRLKDNNLELPFHATLVNSIGSGASNFDDKIYSDGLSGFNNNSVNANITIQFNSKILNNYGEIYGDYKNLNKKTWWKGEDPKIQKTDFVFNLKIYMNDDGKISSYWDNLVRYNDKNKDFNQQAYENSKKPKL